jgi:hypothetical protein
MLFVVGGVFVIGRSRHQGGVVQDDREARLPDGADPPPFREARLA